MAHLSPNVPFPERWIAVLARYERTTVGINGVLRRQMCSGLSNLIESPLHIVPPPFPELLPLRETTKKPSTSLLFSFQTAASRVTDVK